MQLETQDMPVVILAGGYGTTVGSNTIIPKPMVELLDRPMLVHIMDYFSTFGFKKFIICVGYKGELIKDYIHYIPFLDNPIEYIKGSTIVNNSYYNRSEWTIHVVDTGIENQTGSRLAQVESYLEQHTTFILTYGDILSALDLNKLIEFHFNNKSIATLSAVHYPTRFKIVGIQGESNEVKGFSDKPILQHEYISGGYYVLNKELFNLSSLTVDCQCNFETDVLGELVAKKELSAFRYNDFWHALDTDRDKRELEKFLAQRLINSHA